MATVLVGLAQLNHAAIVMPIVVVAIALRWWSEPDRRALLRHYLISVLIAIPAVVAVVASPAFSDSSPRDRLVNFFSTLGPRVLIVVLPMVLVMWARSGSTRLAILGVVCMLGANVALHFPLHVELGWRTLRRTPRPESMQHFLHSNAFQQSHMYRVLRGGDSKLGAYLLLKAGGRLDSEFFPESMALKNFVSPQEYAALLCARRVDMVIAFHSYDATRHMNEHAMLARLEVGVTQPVGWPTASVATHSVDSLAGYEGYEAFSVERRGC